MKDTENDHFFRELAKAYVDNESAVLQKELAEIEVDNRIPQSSRLKRKIEYKKAAHWFKSYGLKALPFAASFIIAVFVYKSNSSNPQTPAVKPPASTSAGSHPVAEAPGIEAPDAATNGENMNSLRYNVEFVSASLPVGYEVINVDYDYGTAIIEIVNDKRNRIILTAEEYPGFDKEEFSEITINGAAVYGIVKNDYSVLKYRKDEMLYTLTSMYGYEDLIEISKTFL